MKTLCFQVKNFRDYIDLFIKDKSDEAGAPLKIVYEQPNPRWEVAITLSDKGFQQASFVNSIATTKVSLPPWECRSQVTHSCPESQVIRISDSV